MQSGYTGHIVAAEWRWVILVGTALVLVAFAPFFWITFGASSQNSWQFMGALHSFPDGATYLAKMLQGGEGGLLVYLQHTPEPHDAMYMQIVYPVLGRVSRLISVSPIVMFHVARVGAALFMYLAIYQLAASIWMRVRTRRIFFMVASLGAGFGWLVASLTGNVSSPDLTVPEMFPLQSTAANVHFPLVLACLALLASVTITAFRPGVNENPALRNGGGIAAMSSVLLAVLYPEVWVLIAVALGVCVATSCMSQRRVVAWAVRWLWTVAAPAAPVIILYAAFLIYNPAMAEWNRQRTAPVPNPISLILSLGIPLILALPGIYRALRRFEPDGDQFMIVWLLTMVVAAYLPTGLHLHFAAGIMIPVAYFASRSLEEVWFQRMSRRWRVRLLIAAMPIMSVSHAMVLFTPIWPVMLNDPMRPTGLFLERAYASAFQWLDEQTQSTDVILASPNVSLWLPAWANARVVYGHPTETLQPASKKQAVLDWYRAADSNDCDALLEGAFAFQERRYSVRYVIFGPQERALGATETCISRLRFVASFGSVRIYVH